MRRWTLCTQFTLQTAVEERDAGLATEQWTDNLAVTDV